MRGWSFLALALGVAAQAAAQPRIDLTPAWDGWSGPGRATEVEVRVKSDTAARGTLEVTAGRQVSRAAVDLPAGRTLRASIPVAYADRLAITLELEGGARERRELALAQSESPLFGLGVTSGESTGLEGFHTVVLDAGDFPRNAAAYSSVDVLAVDSPTLAALDQRQLGALLAFAASCGRLALVRPDPGVRSVLEGAAGCGSRMLVSAESLPEAAELLQQSLALPMASAAASSDLGVLSQPDLSSWRRVVVMLAVYVGVGALALTLSGSAIVAVFIPAAASVMIWALLHAWAPSQRLVVWAESAPGSRVAQYQGWQSASGMLRGTVGMHVLAGLEAARPCEPGMPLRFEFDPARGRTVAAVFDTRLFQTVALCYAGAFPVERALAITARPGAAVEVSNMGTLAWPEGMVSIAGRVYPLPALGPGQSAKIQRGAADAGAHPAAAATLARTPLGGYAAIWPLDLRSVRDAPRDSTAWLLVPVSP